VAYSVKSASNFCPNCSRGHAAHDCRVFLASSGCHLRRGGCPRTRRPMQRLVVAPLARRACRCWSTCGVRKDAPARAAGLESTVAHTVTPCITTDRKCNSHRACFATGHVLVSGSGSVARTATARSTQTGCRVGEHGPSARGTQEGFRRRWQARARSHRHTARCHASEIHWFTNALPEHVDRFVRIARGRSCKSPAAVSCRMPQATVAFAAIVAEVARASFAPVGFAG
jgi:hypothetical protein